MIKRTSQALSVWFLCGDLALTAVAWVGAYYVRFETGWIPVHKTPPALGECWRHLPLVLFLGAREFQETRHLHAPCASSTAMRSARNRCSRTASVTQCWRIVRIT